MPKIETSDSGTLVLPKTNEPIYLRIGVTGLVHEAVTAFSCGDTEFEPESNSFEVLIGTSHGSYDQDLLVRTRIVDMDKDADKVTYNFAVLCGGTSYTYKKAFTFEPMPKKGQSVRFNTVLTLKKP